jgi:hypothetical protein
MNRESTQIMKNLITNPLTRAAIAGAAVWLASVFMAHGQNKPDDLKQKILAQAQSISPDEFAFTRTIRTDQTSNGTTEKKVRIEKFDPTKPAETRWTLVSVDGAPPSADVLKTFRKDAVTRNVPGYHRLAKYFGSPATASANALGRAVLHFTALPKSSVIALDSDVSQNATVDATVGEANGVPFVEGIHITVRPMRIKLVMKLDSFESTLRYRMGAEGKPLMVEQTSDLSGSGLGQTGGAHSVVTYSDYRAVSKR